MTNAQSVYAAITKWLRDSSEPLCLNVNGKALLVYKDKPRDSSVYNSPINYSRIPSGLGSRVGIMPTDEFAKASDVKEIAEQAHPILSTYRISRQHLLPLRLRCILRYLLNIQPPLLQMVVSALSACILHYPNRRRKPNCRICREMQGSKIIRSWSITNAY